MLSKSCMSLRYCSVALSRRYYDTRINVNTHYHALAACCTYLHLIQKVTPMCSCPPSLEHSPLSLRRPIFYDHIELSKPCEIALLALTLIRIERLLPKWKWIIEYTFPLLRSHISWTRPIANWIWQPDIWPKEYTPVMNVLALTTGECWVDSVGSSSWLGHNVETFSTLPFLWEKSTVHKWWLIDSPHKVPATRYFVGCLCS